MRTHDLLHHFTLPGVTRESAQETVLEGIQTWLLQREEADFRITLVQEQTFTLPTNFPFGTWHWYICVGWFKQGQQEDEIGHQIFWYKGQGLHTVQHISYETLGDILAWACHL